MSLFLAVLMVVGVFPVTVLADAQPTPDSIANKGVYIAIYNGESDFPGEPATHQSASGYTNFDQNFKAVSYSAWSDSDVYVHSASGVIDSNVLNVIVEGSDGTWGYVNTAGNGVSDYIIDANIKDRSNVEKMIKAVKGQDTDTTNLDILWYVIKKQAGGWFSDDYWHIDGVIVDKTTYYVSYEGNGATGGEVPSGQKGIEPGGSHTVQALGNLTRKVDGYKSTFMGWSETPDGSSSEHIYQAGEKIEGIDRNITLYAIWEDQAVHDVTINVYLDNVKTEVDAIHGDVSDLYIRSETSDYIKLTNTSTGVYSTTVSGNGNYYVYHDHEGQWEQITANFITVYNKGASMDIHHYSVAYDLGGGNFENGENAKYNKVYSQGKPVYVTSEIPVKTVDGTNYYFSGWNHEEKNYFANEEVTSAISGPITLVAQWAEPTKAKINVTIDQNGGGGFDNSEASDVAEFFLRYIYGTAKDFAPTELTPNEHAGYTYNSNNETHITTYTADEWNYVGLDPVGEYTVYAEKEGYTVTKKVSGSHQEGWVIDLYFKYSPEDFTLNYDAVIEESVSKEIYPNAINVKVTYWGYDVNNVLGWHVISQQIDSDGKVLYIDPETGRGTSNYPVWKYWSESEDNVNRPYYYRVVPESFVMPDGAVVPAVSDSEGTYRSENGIYSAVVTVENGGDYTDYPGGTNSVLSGAYYDENSEQNGRPTIIISANAYNVTFDANGGKVNGKDSDTAENVFTVPAFNGYIAERGDGYTFGGWFEDESCTVPATEGKILSGNTTLYAKWKEPLTVTGEVTVSGTYLLGGETIEINPVDKPVRATVILRKAGQSGTVENRQIVFDWGENYSADEGKQTYSFGKLPDDGSTYYIDIKVNNYTTTYSNDKGAFAADKSSAIFVPGSKTAKVDARLDFAPDSYEQLVIVDATDVGNGFRPASVMAEIIYRNLGSNTVFDVISQHKTPDGTPLSVSVDGISGSGSASEIIWKQFYDGTAYEYQVRIPSTIEDLPCYVTYGNTAHWNGIEASGT
ncbi:MAG: InlB B-repeat-containing protein, partial [Oscillospiraceae bacterium]|nr:InlB B-repeat-containing protein [Oscillospiraceae bacterium]